MTSQSLTPSEGSSKITWGEAIRWTKNFRETFKEAAGIRGYSISVDAIKTLLTQGGNELQGLKMYFGYDDEKNFRLIIVGVKGENGDDYDVPATQIQLENTADGELPDLGDTRPCPIYCGTSNVLNGGE